METADRIIELGLAKVGYAYVNVDDCWMAAERVEGHMVSDPINFPKGMKYLGDYIHAKGLKYGLYSSAGIMTCQKRVGSLGYETVDASYWASFGIDYIKYDNCFNENEPAQMRYEAMS